MLDLQDENDTSFASIAFSERELAWGVTRWLISNFGLELTNAVAKTPFTIPLLCAIACKEAGQYWLPLTPHLSATQILGVCVYDASGDVENAPRSAFPVNTEEFRLRFGDNFTDTLIAEANKARAARGLAPASIVYKGYGLFQYDLQNVLTDEDFFRDKGWYEFGQCVRRAVQELQNKYDKTGNIRDTVRAYNGSGERAEAYAQDVLRLLPLCVAAAEEPKSHYSLASFSSLPVDDDDDPGQPRPGDDAGDIKDFDTARTLANLGSFIALGAPPAGAGTSASTADSQFDITRALAFLDACRDSVPRVTYGLGKKAPFLDAVPGRDFTQIDCSGFVSHVVRLCTVPAIAFPDGSVTEHDWIDARGFERCTISSAAQVDGALRIAFLRPQDAGPDHIGHVVLIYDGWTLESHGGVGPDSRRWDGSGWQSRAFVYQFAPSSQVITEEVAPAFIAVGSNQTDEIPRDRADIAAAIEAHIASEAVRRNNSKPASLISRAAIGVSQKFTGLFTTEGLPEYHDELLVVKMRPQPILAGTAASFNAESATEGLKALSYYERSGAIKQIIPLQKSDAPPPRSTTAMTAFAFTADIRGKPLTEAGVRFIEMKRREDSALLHAALANDPNIYSVSKVPTRYLAVQRTGRARSATGSVGIAATPPSEPIHWNLEKVQWQKARSQAGFKDADDVRVAVLDTGIDTNHPLLSVVPGGYHWQQSDVSAPVSDKDIIGHGTHVSGTISALIGNTSPVQGVCKCELSVWKIFDDQPTETPGAGAFLYYVNPILYRRALAECLELGVDVLNLSIGGRGEPDETERTLFDQLISAGVTICAAMGNDRQYGSPTSYPAALPGVIAIGATGLDDRIAAFSNSGNHIALSAPGKAIWSTLPGYPGQTGFAAVTGSDGTSTQGKPIKREINYDAWDGTSMATPHVTGAAALLIAKNRAAGRQLSPTEVKQLLMSSADKVDGMNGGLFSTDYGAGRLNLMTLLQ